MKTEGYPPGTDMSDLTDEQAAKVKARKQRILKARQSASGKVPVGQDWAKLQRP